MIALDVLFTLITASGLFAMGYAVGRLRRRAPRETPPPPPSPATCTCGHGLHAHDPKTKRCADKNQTKVYLGGLFDGYRQVSCNCLQYVGPERLDGLFPPMFTDPTFEKRTES